MTLILAPLKAELQFFLEGAARVGHAFTKQEGGFDIPSLSCRCFVSGLGVEQTLARVPAILSAHPAATRVVVVGGAGALRPDLNVGDVVRVESLCGAAGGRTPFGPYLEVSQGQVNSVRVVFGVVIVAKGAVSDPETVHGLRAQGADIVTLESDVLRRLVRESGKAYFEFRGVTDHCQGNVRAVFEKNLKVAMGNCAIAFTTEFAASC